ncbi:MAG: peptidoglycan-binding protein [Myxococcales bacterium]|nr:peptidoglycan-binding protein [Myxococcales bacterium]
MPDNSQDLTLAEAREPAPPLHRILTAGVSGHDVARLQSDLHRAGQAPGAVDGVFGDRTTAALAAFAAREALPAPAGSVDAALWSAVLRAGAHGQADALEGLARAHEQAAAAARDQSAVAQKSATDKRAAAAPAGPDEESAAGLLLLAGRQWVEAATQWLAVAAAVAPHADPDGRGFKAHARALNDLDLARAHARRALNSLTLAGKDLEAAGGTDHRDRLAAASLAARLVTAV